VISFSRFFSKMKNSGLLFLFFLEKQVN